MPSLPGLPHLQPQNIYAAGRNYAAHARELENEVPEHPVLFTKPLASLSFSNEIRIPAFVREPHFETELVVAISRQAKDISAEEAHDIIAGYGLGIDITAREIQTELKNKGLPWFLAKGLDQFAPVSRFVPARSIADPSNLSFYLEVNGKKRQTGSAGLMLFPVIELIAKLSKYVTLHPGDLIFTGTPEGVGRLHHNDHLHAEIEPGRLTFDLHVSHC